MPKNPLASRSRPSSPRGNCRERSLDSSPVRTFPVPRESGACGSFRLRRTARSLRPNRRNGRRISNCTGSFGRGRHRLLPTGNHSSTVMANGNNRGRTRKCEKPCRLDRRASPPVREPPQQIFSVRVYQMRHERWKSTVLRALKKRDLACASRLVEPGD